MNAITKLEVTLNNFYVETLNDLVRQFNELVPEHAPYKYSTQDVLELLILKEYVNGEINTTRP